MNYEKLQDATKDVRIIETDLLNDTKGIYVRNNDDSYILIKKDLTNTEKKCILAEEIGHYHTTVGNITDQTIVSNRKQELQGRQWAIDRILPITMLIDAFNAGCRNRYEVADFLDVTKSFFEEAIDYYKRKYGLYFKSNNYIITFEPVGVLKIF